MRSTFWKARVAFIIANAPVILYLQLEAREYLLDYLVWMSYLTWLSAELPITREQGQ